MNKLNVLLTVFFLSTLTISFAQKTDKLSPVLAKQYLDTEIGDELTVWIYFSDKGGNLDQKLAIAEQKIGQRSLERRARSQKNKSLVTYYDIPVLNTYLEGISPFLTKLRHQSKWLNAVSATVNKTKLVDIAELDFVKSIDIVRKGKRNEEGSSSIPLPKHATNHSALYDLDYGPSLTQLEQINIPLVHDLGYTGNDIIICLMDAGFRKVTIHPAFSSMDILDTYDFVNDDDNVDDQADMGFGGHGQNTLSTIGGFSEGNLIGPAYGATYLLAKTENTDSETQVEEDNWVAAAEWAEALGADITSTSLSYTFFDNGSGYGPTEMDGNTAVITIAGDILAGMGVLVVNSAGNYGNGTTTIGAPADGDEVFAIGAVNANRTRVGFSSVGPTADGRIKPDVMAMGAAVVVASGDNAYGTSNGTSFSCPIVAGAAALLWEMVPTASGTQIREALRLSADNADSPNNQYGWGIIDLYAAFELLTSTDEEVPIALCQNTTVALGIDGTVSIEASALDGGSTDNVGIISSALDLNTFNCDMIGTADVMLTVADLAGNEASCIAVVTIIDNLAPVPSTAILPDVTAECEVNNLVAPTAIDNCASTIIITNDADLPIRTIGSTQVNWRYDDGNGNIAEQTQNVVIDDVTKPVVLTQDITIDLGGAPSISIVPGDVDAGSTDNCSVANLSLDINTFTAIGEYTVILSAEDLNGNVSTESALVTVINSTVSTADEIFAKSLMVYPNPANDFVIIDIGMETIKSVIFYTASGKKVKEYSTSRIDVSEIPVGSYFITVTTESEKKASKEIVIFDK